MVTQDTMTTETVPRLYKEARPGADFQNSLKLLQRLRALHPKIPTKSGLMVEGAPASMEGAARPAGSQKTPIGFLQRDPRTLSILWEDGHRDDFDVRDLRLACRCALCIEEMSGRKLLDPKTIRSDVSPRQIMSIGNYAINFDWSDGHNSGIYSFDALRAFGASAAARSIENV